MDVRLLDILVCPICKGTRTQKGGERSWSRKPCKLAFPIRDDIPVMLEDEARQLSADEA